MLIEFILGARFLRKQFECQKHKEDHHLAFLQGNFGEEIIREIIK